ncbi:hypothetical protein [Sinorhizobium medicae]
MPATFIGAARTAGAKALTPSAKPDASTLRRLIIRFLVMDGVPLFTGWLNFYCVQSFVKQRSGT